MVHAQFWRLEIKESLLAHRTHNYLLPFSFFSSSPHFFSDPLQPYIICSFFFFFLNCLFSNLLDMPIFVASSSCLLSRFDITVHTTN